MAMRLVSKILHPQPNCGALPSVVKLLADRRLLVRFPLRVKAFGQPKQRSRIPGVLPDLLAECGFGLAGAARL